MSTEETKNTSFNYDSSIMKDLFFAWIFPLVNFYRRNPPTELNFFDLPKRFEYKDDLKKFKKEWKKIKGLPNSNIFYAIMPIFKSEFIKGVIPGTISNNFTLVNAIMLLYIIDYINGKTDLIVPYIVIYGLSVVFNILCMSYSFRSIILIVAKIKACLTEIIFNKTLKTYYGEISKDCQSGKLTSLISADLELIEGLTVVPFILSIPLLLIGAGIVLWYNIGVAGIIGLLITIFHLPLILYFGKKFANIRIQIASIGDSRIEMITNIIEGIRIIKLYGWESPFLDNLFNIRGKEMYYYKKKTLVWSTCKSISSGSVGLILFVTFSISILYVDKLEPSTAFSSVCILLICNSMVNFVGVLGVTQIFFIMTSFKRISEAMIINEKEKIISGKINKPFTISAKNCEFVWKKQGSENKNNQNQITEEEEEIDTGFKLTKINFKVKKGELVIVIGAVGSGKTALFFGLLNELNLKKGILKTDSSLAFAGEDPWIVSGTIKENIISNQKVDLDFYYDVIKNCCLEKDLELFKEYGDETMIGDRGITLSGGQKARIALARAVYADRNIILLDDPLSAVDPEVCFNLFNNCIKGILKEKTVILATHQAQFVSQADKILILDDGKQIFFGTYQQLIDQNLVEYLGKINQPEIVENNCEVDIESEKIERQEYIEDKKSIFAEVSAKGNVPFKIYWRFFMLGYKKSLYIFITVLIQVAGQVAYLAIVYWIAYWSKGDDQESAFYFYWMAIMVGLLYIFSFLRIFSIFFPLHESAKNLHNLAIKGLTCTASLFFDQNPTGRMLNRFAKDTSQVDEILILYLTETVEVSTLILGNCIAVIIIANYMIIMLTFLVIISIFLVKYFYPTIKNLKRLEQITKSPILSLLNSSTKGLPTIRSLDLENSLKKNMRDLIEVNYKAYSAYQLVFRAIHFYLELGLSTLSLVNVIVLVMLKDSIDPSTAAFSLSISFGTVGWLGYMFKTILETESYMTSAQRLNEYQELKPEGEYDVDKNFVITKGKIEIRNLSMRYRTNYDLTIKNLSFTVQAGMKTGIVGRTGAGKSSIMQVLFRLTNPENGTIYIDGQDYMEAGLHDLRKQMSVIPQSATLFIASLKDNLDPFHEHSNETIIKVLKQVRLGSLLEKLPNGLDSLINSAELSLSGGQKQLVCLARAILRKNKIIMIDEATANVDSETDWFIQKQLKKQFNDCTVLIIAHRLRTVIDSDWIVVMEAGTTVEEGHPKELVKNPESSFMKMIQHAGPDENSYLLAKVSCFN